jgi:hypothetical protein
MTLNLAMKHANEKPMVDAVTHLGYKATSNLLAELWL